MPKYFDDAITRGPIRQGYDLRMSHQEADCKMCKVHFVKVTPNQKYCPTCQPKNYNSYQRDYKRASRTKKLMPN